MLILLSMAVALAAFFVAMLWLDPARRRKAAVAAVVAGGALALSDAAPTVGGVAHACEYDDCMTVKARYLNRGSLTGYHVGGYGFYSRNQANTFMAEFVDPYVNAVTWPVRQLSKAVDHISCEMATIATGTSAAALVVRRYAVTAVVIAGATAMGVESCD